MEADPGSGRRALVAYESHFGCTRTIAEAIARGLTAQEQAGSGPRWQAALLDVGLGRRTEPTGAEDLIVVGGPTHAWGLSRPTTRRLAAAEAAHQTAGDRPDPTGIGIREWIDKLGRRATAAAAFDTRLDGPALLTGRASRQIGHLLQAHGCTLLVPPVSFLVDRRNMLLPGQVERAEAWGAQLGDTVLAPAGEGRLT